MNQDLYTIFWILIVCICLIFLFSNILLAPTLMIVRVIWGRAKSTILSPVKSISIIIPAYNEENRIAIKIDTLFVALKRADVDAEVIIGSDGSNDRTVAIATARINELSAQNWRVIEYQNEGKCRTINKLVGEASGEIIISTDADIPVPENVIELVINAFRANKQLGCLSCIPCFKGLDIGSQKSYWNIEDRIRRAESSFGKLIVVTGMLYAYRKELFEKIPPGVMADDLWIPLTILLKGFESAQVDALRVPYEKTDEGTEIHRRKRVITGGMDVVRRLWPMLIKSPSLFLLVMFHKVNRWALSLWLLIFLGASVALWPPFLLIHSVLGGFAFCVLGKVRFLSLAYAVITPFLSFGEVMLKKDFACWEHIRKHEGG